MIGMELYTSLIYLYQSKVFMNNFIILLNDSIKVHLNHLILFINIIIIV